MLGQHRREAHCRSLGRGGIESRNWSEIINDESGMRPIHYLGNKTRYLAEISSAVESVASPGKVAVDLFSGSGVVARSLAQERPVLASDVQHYSAILSSALCKSRHQDMLYAAPIISKATDWLGSLGNELTDLLKYEDDALASVSQNPDAYADYVEKGIIASGDLKTSAYSRLLSRAASVLEAAGGTVSRYYGGAYFSFRQALEIDALSAAIKYERSSPGGDTFLAALLGSASDSVGTVGNHFAQPMRLRDRVGVLKMAAIQRSVANRTASAFNLFEKKLSQYNDLTPTAYECTTAVGDYRDILSALKRNTSVIYADPPYTRDHYSRFYHVLETIALGDDPGVASAPGSSSPSRGLYRKERHQSPFSIRSQASKAFEDLFSLARQKEAAIVLSYSPQGQGTKARPNTRLISIDELVQIAKVHFAKVDVMRIEKSVHSKFNATRFNGVAAPQAEVMISASL
ncbi:hypothetical protein B5P19_09900 [Clavibacter sepedonicus]|nr:hypothetical protein B5P19_09900 [Clavibacter sepedonicus]OQJ54076.1 hypothetical protein B5P20_08080 [Clavibacter sepedonicus]